MNVRKKIIAGNWKMNKTPSETVALLNELKPLVANEEVDVVFCVPAISLTTAIDTVKGTNIKIGAENMHWEESGAYTGEIAPNMLTDIGVEYVIIGHSERRLYFDESNDTVNKNIADFKSLVNSLSGDKTILKELNNQIFNEGLGPNTI